MNTDTAQSQITEETLNPAITPSTSPQIDPSQSKPKSLFDNIPQNRKNLYIVLFVVIAPPLGLILMWMWSTWPRWIKILITLAIIIIPLFGLGMFTFIASFLS